MSLEARNALLEAAKEARTRGDIGKEGCVEVWTWLEYWADRNYPEVKNRVPHTLGVLNIVLLALALAFIAASSVPLYFLINHSLVMAGVFAVLLWVYAGTCIALMKWRNQ